MAGGTRHSHRGTRVLEKPQPTAFPNCALWPGSRASSLHPRWGLQLWAGGADRRWQSQGTSWRPRPVQTSPSFKAELTLPTALCCLLPEGGLRLLKTSPPRPSCLWAAPRPISTSSPPPVPSTLKSTYSFSVELTQGWFSTHFSAWSTLTLQGKCPRVCLDL